MEETAKCRGCGKKLIGKPYYLGGHAYDPKTMERAKINQFGGYVCSYNCDRSVCMKMIESMPGAGPATRLDSHSQKKINENWRGR